MKKIAIDDKCPVAEGRESSDFQPGLGHRVEDRGMRKIQCILSAALI
ncbi:MAG: hypothetical protein MUP41_14115 [Desulfobacterales bacterium]|nr:hypothetical protein [Desulfobacterales bacterium]